MSRLTSRLLLATAGLTLPTLLAGCLWPNPGIDRGNLHSPASLPVEKPEPGQVRVASFEQPAADSGNSPFRPEPLSMVEPGQVVATAEHDGEMFPIDLPLALQLGGANNLQIRLVAEQVRQAYLQLRQARVLWVPSLRAGVGYNRHDGRLQATEGDVFDAGRNSLMLGGGVASGTSPITGGASGPARLVVDLSLADVWFEKLAARQMWCATEAARAATINDTLLAIALGYYDLLEAHGLLADAETGLAATDEMVDLTSKFEAQGQMALSDVARAQAEQGLWRRAVEDARRRTIDRSAELVRLLRLDPHVALVPAEDRIVPVEMIDHAISRDQLLDEALARRPELHQYRHVIAATKERFRQEQWRPWLPHVAVGYSAGTFGGGRTDTFDSQNGRGDFDALAVWELQNFGIGNHILRRQRASQNRQAYLQWQMIRDRVISEVTTASADADSYQRQIRWAAESLQAANRSYRLNVQRIRQGEGLPIELLQAIRARITALDAYAKAVASYNRAQFQLLRAVGEPPRSP